MKELNTLFPIKANICKIKNTFEELQLKNEEDELIYLQFTTIPSFKSTFLNLKILKRKKYLGIISCCSIFAFKMPGFCSKVLFNVRRKIIWFYSLKKTMERIFL